MTIAPKNKIALYWEVNQQPPYAQSVDRQGLPWRQVHYIYNWAYQAVNGDTMDVYPFFVQGDATSIGMAHLLNECTTNGVLDDAAFAAYLSGALGALEAYMDYAFPDKSLRCLIVDDLEQAIPFWRSYMRAGGTVDVPDSDDASAYESVFRAAFDTKYPVASPSEETYQGLFESIVQAWNDAWAQKLKELRPLCQIGMYGIPNQFTYHLRASDARRPYIVAANTRFSVRALRHYDFAILPMFVDVRAIANGGTPSSTWEMTIDDFRVFYGALLEEAVRVANLAGKPLIVQLCGVYNYGDYAGQSINTITQDAVMQLCTDYGVSGVIEWGAPVDQPAADALEVGIAAKASALSAVARPRYIRSNRLGRRLGADRFPATAAP